MRYEDFKKVMDAKFTVEYSSDKDKNYIKNKENFLWELSLTIDNERKLSDAIRESKARKIKSIVWEGYIYFATQTVRMSDELDFPGQEKMQPNSAQLKKWLNETFNGYDTFNQLIADYTEERNHRMKEKEKEKELCK